MRRTNLTQIACVLLLVLTSIPALAQGPAPGQGRDPALEREVLDRLGKINREAVPIFEQATRDVDAGNLFAARAGYERVLAMAPGFDVALRRLSYAEVAAGMVESGLKHAERALAIEESPYNHEAVARALLAGDDRSAWQKGLEHATTAHRALPDDAGLTWVWLAAGTMVGDEATLREAVPLGLRLFPDHPLPHYAAGWLALLDKKTEQAERELGRARELGLSAEEVDRVMADMGVPQRARVAPLTRERVERWRTALPGLKRLGGIALGVWLGTPLLLVSLGLLCNRLTLAALRDPAFTLGAVGPAQRLLRAIYRGTNTLAALVLHTSLVLFLVVPLGVPMLFLWADILITRQFYLPTFLGSLVLAWAVFSLVRERVRINRHRHREMGGVPVARAQAPILWALADGVARLVGTDPVAEIRLFSDAGIGVTEEGSLRQRLRGRGRRILLLGLGALGGLTQADLRAILAHEYGHFVHGDAIGGRLAFSVLETLAYNLWLHAAAGRAHWYNLDWLIARASHDILARITAGARRLEEGLADRCAAMAYGPRSFACSLQAIARQQMVFRLQWADDDGGSLRLLQWLPRMEIVPPPPGEEVEEGYQQELTRRTSSYDLHLALAERLEVLAALDLPDLPDDRASLPAWELFPDRVALQQLMTGKKP